MLSDVITKVRNALYDLTHGYEPVVALNLISGAAAAAAVAVSDVDNTDWRVAAVAGVWAVVTFLERQLVRPEKAAEANDDYANYLEELLDENSNLDLRDSGLDLLFPEEAPED